MVNIVAGSAVMAESGRTWAVSLTNIEMVRLWARGSAGRKWLLGKFETIFSREVCITLPIQWPL